MEVIKILLVDDDQDICEIMTGYLVDIFEEARNILINQAVNYQNILNAFYLNAIYLVIAISLFYYSFGREIYWPITGVKNLGIEN